MDWTEAWLREQAGWQAYKRGRELAAQGVARTVRRRGSIVSGVFPNAKRPLRCVVKEEGGHLAVECGCATNRATGEICEHAVALVLNILTQNEPPPAAGAEEPGPARQDVTPVPLRIRLPDRWGDMLQAGRLQLRLEETDAASTEADRSFATFLLERGAGTAGIIQLGEDDIAATLDALAGHPRIQLEGGRMMRIADGVLDPLVLADSRCEGGEVHLTMARDRIRVFPLGGETGGAIEKTDAIELGRLPAATPSGSWRDQLATLARNGRLVVPADRFLHDLEAWLDVFADPAPGWLGRLHFEAARPEHRITIEGSLNALEASVELRYPGGDFTPDPEVAAADFPRVTNDHLQIRSREGEGIIARRLASGGWEADEEQGRFRMRDDQRIPLWLADDLPGLETQATVVVGERLQHVMQRLHVVSPRLEITEGQDLACELSFQTGGGRSLDPAKIRAILRKGTRSAKTRDGSVIVVRREATEVVEPLLMDLGLMTSDQQFRVTKAQEFLIREYHNTSRNSLATCGLPISSEPIPDGLIAGELRPYQQTGVAWLFERLSELSGALLGDEMGLGKTVQAIAVIQWLLRQRKGKRVLLLAPTSLIGNWESELGAFAPGLKLCRHTGPGRDERRDQALQADVLLTSYGTFQQDRAFHLGQRYDLAICDEASLLRNPDSQLSRTVAKLDAERRLALSGTPVENRLEDLWSIFRFVAPGYLGARDDFKARYGGDEAEPGALRRLPLRISPYYLRRTKREVAPELPDKLIVDEWLDLGEDARSLYQGVAKAGLAELESIESEGAARMHLLTVLLRLRQICLSPRLVDEQQTESPVKIERVHRLLEERRESGGKTLVFSQFAGFLKDWESADELPVDHVFRLDGATRNRAELVRRFQGCEGSAVFLISLKAGGYGLNLTAADTVVHMDPWWNPAVENQATDRAHRIGQTQPVTVYRLLARDTVEERVRRIQSHKRDLMSVSESQPIINPGENWERSELAGLIQ